MALSCCAPRLLNNKAPAAVGGVRRHPEIRGGHLDAVLQASRIPLTTTTPPETNLARKLLQCTFDIPQAHSAYHRRGRRTSRTGERNRHHPTHRKGRPASSFFVTVGFRNDGGDSGMGRRRRTPPQQRTAPVHGCHRAILSRGPGSSDTRPVPSSPGARPDALGGCRRLTAPAGRLIGAKLLSLASAPKFVHTVAGSAPG